MCHPLLFGPLVLPLIQSGVHQGRRQVYISAMYWTTVTNVSNGWPQCALPAFLVAHAVFVAVSRI